MYAATEAGTDALRDAKSKVWELFQERFEDELQGHDKAEKTADKKAVS